VVHSDSDEEGLYACCCIVHTEGGCQRCTTLAVTVHRYLHGVQWS